MKFKEIDIKIILFGYTVKDFSSKEAEESCGRCKSQTHYSLQRLLKVKLINKTLGKRYQLNRVKVDEFMEHVFKYLFDDFIVEKYGKPKAKKA